MAKAKSRPKNEFTFWFDPASSYSYLSAMRVDGVAAVSGVAVLWRPFLLGPIFKAQGMDTSPFNLFPVKGNYMWRDMQRQCAQLEIAFAVPRDAAAEGFPRNSLLAARASVVALREPWGRDFVRLVYQAEFGKWFDIADPQVIAACVRAAGGDDEAVLAATQTDEIKAELRANTEHAFALGIFGAPSFTVGSELFWGNDRLEEAVEFASKVKAGK
ncbi:MAG: 2-hydroxychromene-2-carboxylate isomerase [Nitratireductor sp.]|nr:2-hydroxychromene-2-carboxylate isomerase [Nitratireductor sp.]